jgi:hypothetical protein
MSFYPCVTCGQEICPIEGLNCPRCASGGAQQSSLAGLESIHSSENVKELHKENAKKIAAALMNGINWGSTKEAKIGEGLDGTSFWNAIYRRLIRIATRGE